jgi:membrane-associated phospholipid phosphatase
MRVPVVLALTACLSARSAQAQIPLQAENPLPTLAPPALARPTDRLRLSVPWDGAVAAASSATLVLSLLIPVDQTSRWNTQLLPFDSHLEGRYSGKAASLSNVLLAIDVAVPPALFLGQGIDAAMGQRTVVYGETLLVSLALDYLAKPLVSRPRPYTYSTDTAVTAQTQSEGKDTHLSFYSRHASTTFAASVSGALLFAQSTSDTNARAAVWFAELALASATADLRTRAGMHFYSDVLVGAAIGSAVGVTVPYLHGARPHLSKLEWLAIVLAPFVGIALGELLPVGG